MSIKAHRKEAVKFISNEINSPKQQLMYLRDKVSQSSPNKKIMEEFDKIIGRLEHFQWKLNNY
jgi:DNA-directed RNA polymerase subunit L